MNRLRNEQGYALVTVLLIVTIFMILFLSFMGQAFNSVKQNQVTEKSSLSVAAAEMGVSYYQVEVQRIFESKQLTISDYLKNNPSLQTNFKREAAVKTAAELQSAFSAITTQPAIPVDSDPNASANLKNASFIIKNFVAVPDSNPSSSKVKISFNIVGTENHKDTTLTANMTIDLDTITNLTDYNDPNNYVLPTFNTVTIDPVVCTSLDCNKVYIIGDGSFTGNNDIKDNQIIYTTGSVDFNGNGNENNKTNVKIHADGSVSIHQNMESASNVVIESKSTANFLQNLKMTNASKLSIFNNLYVGQNFELANHSFAYVGSSDLTAPSTTSAKINNNLVINSSSKMCVNGNLNAKSISVDSSSNLLVLGKVMENGVERFNYELNRTNVTDLNNFKMQCGTFVPPNFQIKWGDNVNTVVNDVSYN